MDILNISQSAMSIITNEELIQINQDLLGVQAHHVANDSNDESKEIWAGPLNNGDIVVMLFNSGTATASITVLWSQLGLASNTVVNVRDLWAHEDLGKTVTQFTGTNIPSHGQITLRLSPQQQEKVHAKNNHILFPPNWTHQP